MKELVLNRGLVAKISDCDLVWASQFHWYAEESKPGKWYVRRHDAVRKRGHRPLHLEIARRMGIPGMVDHRDHNTLNDQRENIRSCDYTQNARNTRKREGKHYSRFKGVCRTQHGAPWRAYLTLAARQIHLGCFDDEETAARAYDAAAVKYFGEFACLNFSK